jgi:sodium transport system permease protein
MSLRSLRIVFAKELLDHFRDRRALLTTLFMGPLFGPIIFGFVITLSLNKSITDDTTILELPIIGAERAPNLVGFLSSENIDHGVTPESRDQALLDVKAGSLDVVLVIPESFGDELSEAIPARVELIYDRSDDEGRREADRVATALRAYGQEISTMRLLMRGVSPATLQALNVDRVDVSTPSGRSAMLLGMLSYFFIFAMLMGGMPLSIDATAGERERGSLEPLLCLPVTRDRLILGKILAACVFMLTSLSISLCAFAIALNFMPLEKLGMTPNFGPQAVVTAFAMLAPFVLLGASLMTLVASFTKSYKEAQSWLSVVLLAPTMPILIVSILNVRSATELMLIPSLSQHLLLVDLIKNEQVALLSVALSVASTIVYGVAAAWICARLYRREGLLG